MHKCAKLNLGLCCFDEVSVLQNHHGVQNHDDFSLCDGQFFGGISLYIIYDSMWFELEGRILLLNKITESFFF